MSALEQPLVYTTDQSDASLELADYTAAISAASTNEERLRLLAQKQEVEQALRPLRRSPDSSEKPDIYLTRGGQDWRVILAEKQRQDRIRRRDAVVAADINVML